jgi:hypothetical protein
VTGTGNPNAKLGVTGRVMPPLLRMPAANVRYYKIHFLDDGYPAQRKDDGSFYAHPIYPTYVTQNYLQQYKHDGDVDALKAARRVMAAALARAEAFGDAQVLWYDAESDVGRANKRHYSGLTQARYVDMLICLSKATGEKSYRKAAARFAAALTIPVEDGGVARIRPEGIGIEELPLAMPELVLNGWLTALSLLAKYPKFLKQAKLRKFMDANLALVEHLLPLYDVPALHNSRYGLSGVVQLRLTAKKGQIVLTEPRVSWSQSESFPVVLGHDGGWRNILYDTTARAADGGFASIARQIRANLVFSQLASENAWSFTLAANRVTTVDVEIREGTYSPLAAAPADAKWTLLETLSAGKAPQAVRIALGAPHTGLVGYPTGFRKAIGGTQRNIYHLSHIVSLYRLSKLEKRPMFRDYAARWTRYIAQWPNDPVYAGIGEADYSEAVPLPLHRYLSSAQSQP